MPIIVTDNAHAAKCNASPWILQKIVCLNLFEAT